MYSALAGDKQGALELLEEAIHADVRYYGKAAVDPDLEGIRDEVLGLLARLAREAERKAKDVFAAAAKESRAISNGMAGSQFVQLKDRTGQMLKKIQNALRSPSYSMCLCCVLVMEPLRRCLQGLREFLPVEAACASRSAEYEKCCQNYRGFLAKPTVGAIIAHGIWWTFYGVSGFVFATPLVGGCCESLVPSILLIIFLACIWPLMAFCLLINGFQRNGGPDLNYFAGGVGLAIAVLIQSIGILTTRCVEKELSGLAQLAQSRDQAERELAAIVDGIEQGLQEASRRWSAPIHVPQRQLGSQALSGEQHEEDILICRLGHGRGGTRDDQLPF